MTRIKILLLLFLFLCTRQSFAQIKILLLNGKIKAVSEYEIKGLWMFYKKTNDVSGKLKKIDKYEVFSAIQCDGSEEVIYDPDTSLEGDPSVEEVRKYINGEQFAMSEYGKRHNTFNSIGGAAAGLASSAIAFYGPIGVFTYSMILGRFNPKLPREMPDNIKPADYNTEEFLSGYQKTARNQKVKTSLIFGGIGFAIGFPLLVILSK